MSEARFEIVGYGVDDITIGFDMTGSRAIDRLNTMPGLESKRGKMLGQRSTWGSFGHLIGRSVSFWRAETARLYVQAKLGSQGGLCPFDELASGVEALMARMAIVGVIS